MPHRRLSLPRAVLTSAGVAVTLLTATGATSAASPAKVGRISRTQLFNVRPVTAKSVLKPGYKVAKTLTGATCNPGSNVIERAYRCFAGNGVYDPCWAWNEQHRAALDAVLCLAYPWSRNAVALRVPNGLAATTGPRTPDKGDPWGLRLANGSKCIASQFSSPAPNGRYVSYECEGPSLVVVGDFDTRRPLWLVRTGHWSHDRLVVGPVLSVTTAWYGLSTQY